MKRTLILLCTSLIVISIGAQTKVFKQKVKLSSSLFIKKEAYPIVDHEDNATILLLDADEINAYKFNSKFEITDSIEIKI